MRSVTLLIAATLLALCGCASLGQTGAPDVYPHLVQSASLPPWPFVTANKEISIKLKLHVNRDGSVNDVSLLTPSGDDQWDSLALGEIRRWQFSPALVDGHPVSLWLHETVRIQFENLGTLPLAEIVCSERSLADSLYTLLTSGTPFDSLAKMFSLAASRSSGGSLGDVDLWTLPFAIRHEVANLHPGDITRPLRFGDRFIIYKRVSRGA